MENAQDIRGFIELLRNDPACGPEIAAYRYVPPVPLHDGTAEIRDEVKRALSDVGISRLYSHQAEAIELVRGGSNVVVMTPTASGKSLIYNIPVVESILEDPEARALYVFPLKGLEQDQVRNLNDLLAACGVGEGARGAAHVRREKVVIRPAEVYDGDTTAHMRKKIREKLPNVLFTNPDMIHLALNPYHEKWAEFFGGLRYVVLDEVHSYRGVFGSHVSHVCRRLRRVCGRWGGSPQFIASSATIANPKELAETLTGLPFSLVANSGAPRSGKHFLFINPSESPYTTATRLFLTALQNGLRTMVFTKARKITELIYAWCAERAPSLAHGISPYRAGFLPSERREIERRLFSGELRGVITTSALELGVDIGGLDVCILCGYPGSISSLWQRAGRVGRHGRESLILMIALKDAMDQYVAAHPDTILERTHERAVCSPGNSTIRMKHLLCAADEIPLGVGDQVYDYPSTSGEIAWLEREGLLRKVRAGNLWLSSPGNPQRGVGIRSIGISVQLRDEGGTHIGDLDGRRIYREAFPGAVYLHKGRQYEVVSLDLEGNQAVCRQVSAGYYTRALTEEHVEVTDKAPCARKSGHVRLCHGTLRITYRVVGFEKRHLYEGGVLSRHGLELPAYVFDTEGLWIDIGEEFSRHMAVRDYDMAGTLHAAEHAAISCIPLYALCDKGDLGGVSYTFYQPFGGPAIFAYDGCEGGVGLTRQVLSISFAGWPHYSHGPNRSNHSVG
ncbi:MAG TPA: DEAD/DEAH box helicase [Dissulfurispiraceae bacterium]|nr:DEAD/DEAH box helicase [Dissulfurispiraceae bacterium]